MKWVYMETGERKLMRSGNRNDGWICMEMGIYVDVAGGVVMQAFHACEKEMGMVARERKVDGNDNG